MKMAFAQANVLQLPEVLNVAAKRAELQGTSTGTHLSWGRLGQVHSEVRKFHDAVMNNSEGGPTTLTIDDPRGKEARIGSYAKAQSYKEGPISCPLDPSYQPDLGCSGGVCTERNDLVRHQAA